MLEIALIVLKYQNMHSIAHYSNYVRNKLVSKLVLKLVYIDSYTDLVLLLY